MSRRVPDRLHSTAVHAFRAILLVVWGASSFGVAFFARELEFSVAGWPANYWLAAQGSVMVFIVIVVLYALVMNRIDRPGPQDEDHG